jgi:hypothetical protein
MLAESHAKRVKQQEVKQVNPTRKPRKNSHSQQQFELPE